MTFFLSILTFGGTIIKNSVDITTIYAEIQINPRNIVAYRQLVEHYKICNMPNEAEAFQELIQRISDVDGTDINEEQQSHDQNMSRISSTIESSNPDR